MNIFVSFDQGASVFVIRIKGSPFLIICGYNVFEVVVVIRIE